MIRLDKAFSTKHQAPSTKHQAPTLTAILGASFLLVSCLGNGVQTEKTAANAASGGTSDTTRPTIVSMTPAASTVGLTQNVSVVVTMSEAVRGVTTSNLSPSCGSVTAVSGDNSTTLTFTVDVNGGGGAACSDGDTLTASFSTSGLTDAAGNTATGSDSKAYTVDGTPLQVMSVTAAVVGLSIQVTIDFGEAPSVVSGETLDVTDFNFMAGSCAADINTWFGTSISGSTLVVSFADAGCVSGDDFEMEFANPAAEAKIADDYGNVTPTYAGFPQSEFGNGGGILTLTLP